MTRINDVNIRAGNGAIIQTGKDISNINNGIKRSNWTDKISSHIVKIIVTIIGAVIAAIIIRNYF